MLEVLVRSLDQKDPLEKEMATHSNILSGKSHGRRSLVGYNPWGSQKVGHDVGAKQQQVLADVCKTTESCAQHRPPWKILLQNTKNLVMGTHSSCQLFLRKWVSNLIFSPILWTWCSVASWVALFITGDLLWFFVSLGALSLLLPPHGCF